MILLDRTFWRQLCTMGLAERPGFEISSLVREIRERNPFRHEVLVILVQPTLKCAALVALRPAVGPPVLFSGPGVTRNEQ